MIMMLFFTLLLGCISASAASVNDAVAVNDVNMTTEKPNKNGFPLLPAGVSISNHAPNPPLQIVGGTETAGPVDFMVGLGYSAKGSSSNAPFCGGSLIAPNIVLTAAHCVSSQQEVELYKVLVNMHDVTNTSGVEAISLNPGVLGENIIIHHSYDDDTTENDVALMILPHDVTGITYAQINEDANIPGQAGDRLRVIGWGTTSSGGELSNILLEAEVEYTMNKQCNDAYSKKDGDAIKDGMMCAASDGIDTCQGDSGGPMMLASDEGDPVQVGIVSWGYGCADPNYPGVYTRVSYYADWIKETACAFTGDFCPTCDVSQKLMKVIVHTDRWPEETSWEVTGNCDKSSDPIMSGGPYPEESKLVTLVTVDCVPEGEYEFTIKDSYGDGNCCGSGYGYYSFQYDDEEVIGGDFGSTETKSLGSCTTSSPTPQPTNTQVPTEVSTTFEPTQSSSSTSAPTPSENLRHRR